MDNNVLGRTREIEIFNRLLDSNSPKFLAVYGRRRVGKTFLIREYFKQHIQFAFTGSFEESTRNQLSNFFKEYISKTKKAVVTTLISTFPAIKNEYYFEEINSEVVMEDLFVKL